MREIKTWRDPYAMGFNICRKRKVELEPGLTVLVGCNGTGKSTLLKNIQSELDKAKIPCVMFDNLYDGGHSARSEASFNENFTLLSQLVTSSEGESINMNMCVFASHLADFIDTGKYSKHDRGEALINLFRDEEDIKKEAKELKQSKERWILLDAVDSGYSIDNVVELKTFLNLVLDDGKKQGLDTYIVASANEYELACNEKCFDVYNGSYIEFKDYDDYRKHVLKTRERKDKRKYK